MAESKKQTKKNTFKNELEPEKKGSKKKSSIFKDTNMFFKNDKTHGVLGVFLLLFSMYLAFSFISSIILLLILTIVKYNSTTIFFCRR